MLSFTIDLRSRRWLLGRMRQTAGPPELERYRACRDNHGAHRHADFGGVQPLLHLGSSWPSMQLSSIAYR